MHAMISPSPLSDSDISVHFTKGEDRADTVEIVVIVPTFKRPQHLLATLKTVLNQSTKRSYAVVIMDNDAHSAEGAAAAAGLLSKHDLPSTVILAHRRGNCAAYNAGIHTALTTYPNVRWIQIIDDDELAHRDWLDLQAAAAQETNADFVGAPQHPVFEEEGDQIWSSHPVFEPPYKNSGVVPILFSSGNVLISASLLKRYQHPWLDESYNFLGGGDSDFYSRCKQQGATFAWCHEAGVEETTPTRRTQLSWLNSRSLRNGSISALIQKKAAQTPFDDFRRIGKSLLLLAVSPYRSLILFVNKRSLIMALNPMNVALGRVLMEFGFANEQYKSADKN